MRWLPARDFWPFWPRPAVLPLPEPSPRPTRLRSRWLPSAGRSSCSPGALVVSSAIDLLHLHERAHAPQHALEHGRVVALGLGVDAAQAERPQRATVLGPDAGGAAHLGDPEPRHQASSPPSGFSASAAVSASALGARLRGARLGFGFSSASAGAASASGASGSAGAASAAASSAGAALGSAFGFGAAFGLTAAFGFGAALGLTGSGGAGGGSASPAAAAASASAWASATTSECGLM